MVLQRTEQMRGEAKGLDVQPPLAVLDILLASQKEAVAAVQPALGALADAASLAADTIRGGGRLGYAAAGSSGLMALADALELPGTFGIPRDRIAILFAGGPPCLDDLVGGPEDDEDLAERDVAAAGLGAGDCLVSVSASGSTPYAVAALRAAGACGARRIAIANNDGAALFDDADVAVLIATPPEPIAGSTRMGAGTAQKVALNLFSTLMAIELGHVHDGYMVNVKADNRKLKDRAARMVAAIADTPEADAAIWLERAGGSVKAAVLMAAGAADEAAANRLLQSAGQRLRPALSMIRQGRNR